MAKTLSISMVELRDRAEEIVREVEKGRRYVLTYRGRPVLRLEPCREAAVSADDPFYRLADLAEAKTKTLTNDEIDKIVYGA